MDRFEMERFTMQFRRPPVTLKFPREDRGVVFIVAQCFPLRGLMFFAKMRATRFVASKRVRAHQLGKLKKICNATGALERLVKILIGPWDAHFVPEGFSQFRNFLEGFAQSFGVSGHSTFFPEKEAKFAMDGIE